jgi:glutamate racemase
LDDEQALRPTIITAGSTWTKRSQKSLLSPPSTATLSAAEQDRARTEAFDLLDALSRSGSLAIDCAELHVVLACTHNFTKSLIDTVVQDNVNPIEKVERSALILATTVHDKQPSELIKPEQRERIATYSRVVFIEEEKQRALLASSASSGEEAAASSSSVGSA